MMTVREEHSAGLTLIGVLIATVIFATILTATFGLVARATHQVGQSRENFIATNLAREGLELVQLVRDTNMLSQSDWTGNVGGGDPLCADDGENRLIVDQHEAFAHGVRVQQSDNTRLYLDQGRYVHSSADTTPTDYNRRITISCLDRATPGDEHIDVVSQVTWQSRGTEHTVELRNRLYNWYQ